MVIHFAHQDYDESVQALVSDLSELGKDAGLYYLPEWYSGKGCLLIGSGK